MVASYSSNPSSFMRLIAASGATVGTAAEDMGTFFDMTPFEAILVTVTCVGTVTATSLTLKFVSSAASSGSSPVTAKGPDGTTVIIGTIGTPALGTTISQWVRTRGLLKFGSPQIATGGAACDVAVSIYGVAPRDTSEISAGWIGTTTALETAQNTGVEVTSTAMS